MKIEQTIPMQFKIIRPVPVVVPEKTTARKVVGVLEIVGLAILAVFSFLLLGALFAAMIITFGVVLGGIPCLIIFSLVNLLVFDPDWEDIVNLVMTFFSSTTAIAF